MSRRTRNVRDFAVASTLVASFLVLSHVAGANAQSRPSGFQVSASVVGRVVSPPTITGRFVFTRLASGHGRTVSVTVKLWRSPAPGYGSTRIATATRTITRSASSATIVVSGRCVPYTRRRPPLVWFMTADYTVRGGHGAVIGTYRATSGSSYHHCR